MRFHASCLLMLVCFLALGTGCNQKTANELPKSDPANEPVAEMPKESSDAEATSTDVTSKEVVAETVIEAATELTLPEALKQVNDGSAVLVDVRSDKEWNESHFAQAQHISIDKINEDASAACAGLNKDQIVLLH